MSGGSKSSTQTSSTSQYYDQRSVIDAGGGIVGNGNTVTDGRAFSVVRDVGLAQADLAKHIADTSATVNLSAFDVARNAQEGAVSTSKSAFDLAGSSFSDVLDLTRSVVAQAGTQASTAASTAAAAYQSAADTSSGNKTLIYAALAAVAVIGLAVAFRN